MRYFTTHHRKLKYLFLLMFMQTLGMAESRLPAVAWHRSPHKLPPNFLTTLQPVALYYKQANFGSAGNIRWFPQATPGPFENWAWISHRLSKNETLQPTAAARMAKSLATAKAKFKAIQLDIEPLAVPPGWLSEFLKPLRKTLKVPITLAIPPVSALPIAGLSWRPDAAKQILSHVSGLDLMLYDTGLTRANAYRKLLLENFAFARRTILQTSKTISLGFPTYEDKTKWHLTEVENLEVVFQALQAIPAKERDFLCNPRLRFAYYAAWTMDAKELEIAKNMHAWRKRICD